MKRVSALVLIALLSVAYGWREEGAARFAGKKFTTTVVVGTTLTTTVHASCALTINGVACGSKRRRRNAALRKFLPEVEADPAWLGGSLEEAEAVRTGVAAWLPSIRLRRGLIDWVTVFSTFTVTSSSTDSATILSLAFQCSAPGAVFPPDC